MPLSKKGKKLLRKFRQEYGKKKGTSVFYATENKGEIKGLVKRSHKKTLLTD